MVSHQRNNFARHFRTAIAILWKNKRLHQQKKTSKCRTSSLNTLSGNISNKNYHYSWYYVNPPSQHNLGLNLIEQEPKKRRRANSNHNQTHTERETTRRPTTGQNCRRGNLNPRTENY